MESLFVQILLDTLMAGLLVATIVYCVKLNRRIHELNDSRAELTTMIQRFDEATDRARATITELQQTGKQLNEKLGTRIEKANYMADDLSFMIEKGGKIADQMEDGFSRRRSGPGTAEEAPPARSRAVAVAQENPEPALPRQRDVQPPAQAQPQRAVRNAPSVRMRSKAEQELLDAVKGNKG